MVTKYMIYIFITILVLTCNALMLFTKFTSKLYHLVCFMVESGSLCRMRKIMVCTNSKLLRDKAILYLLVSESQHHSINSCF